MLFSVITKNLNWEILTKNLLTFKKWDKVRNEKFNMGVSILKGHKKPIQYLKKVG